MSASESVGTGVAYVVQTREYRMKAQSKAGLDISPSMSTVRDRSGLVERKRIRRISSVGILDVRDLVMRHQLLVKTLATTIEIFWCVCKISTTQW